MRHGSPKIDNRPTLKGKEGSNDASDEIDK